MPKAKTRSERPFIHPLSGADMATFLSVLSAGGWPKAAALPGTALAFLAALFRQPFSLVERPIASARIGRLPDEPPIFLLGHWRSGTTHLYNVMSKGNFAFVDPLAAGMPWDLLGLVRWLRPLLERALPTERFVDALAVEPDSPQEDELSLACMTPHSYYHAVYFPKAFDRLFERGLFQTGLGEKERLAWQGRLKHLYGKLRLAQPGKPLLIKNPAHTHRIAELCQLFPGAKFIHIVRSPYEVFASTRAFYRALLPALALQDFSNVDVEELTLQTYPRLMGPLIKESAKLPASHFIELRYEEMEQTPIACLQRIYSQLGLGGFDAAKPKFDAYLTKVGGYKARHKSYDPRDLDLVDRHWRPFLDHWHYERPNGGAP